MRAKLIENKIGFIRGQDSKSSLGVGVAGKAKELLEKIYFNHRYLSFKFISSDKSIIRYSEKALNRANFRSNPTLPVWIIKYSIIPKYFSAPYEKKGDTWLDEKTTYKYWSVWQRYINDSPSSWEIRDEREIDISDTKKEGEAKLKTEIIADAFNEKFDPIEGFELVERFDFPIESYNERVRKL